METILSFDKARLLPIIFTLLSIFSNTSSTEMSYAFIILTNPDVALSTSIPGEIKANCELNLAIFVAASADPYPKRLQALA